MRTERVIVKNTGKEIRVLKYGPAEWVDVTGRVYSEDEIEFPMPPISIGDMVSYKEHPPTVGVVEQINDQMLMICQESGNRMVLPVRDCSILKTAKAIIEERFGFLHKAAESIYLHIGLNGVTIPGPDKMALFDRSENVNSSKDGNTYRVQIRVEIKKI